MGPSSTTEAHMARNLMPRNLPYPYHFNYPGGYLPEWYHQQEQNMKQDHNPLMFPNAFNNIVYDAKATLASGPMNPLQHSLLPHAGVGIHMPVFNSNDKFQQNKTEVAKATLSNINIKGEEDDQNHSKLPVKVLTGKGQDSAESNTDVPEKSTQIETPKNQVKNGVRICLDKLH